MAVPYVPPSFKADGFNCPFCHTYADQGWGMPSLLVGSTGFGQQSTLWTCRCSRCKQFSLWVNEKCVPFATDSETVARLFGLVNLIAEVMISQPKHVRAMYESVVPEAQRKAIAERDEKAV